MAPASGRSSQFALTLNEEERSYLLDFLEQGLRDKQVEVHRTDAFAARSLLQHQAEILENLVRKLRQA